MCGADNVTYGNACQARCFVGNNFTSGVCPGGGNVFSTSMPVTPIVNASTTVPTAFELMAISIDGGELTFEFTQPLLFFNTSRILFTRPPVQSRRRAGAMGDEYTLTEAPVVITDPAAPEKVVVQITRRDERALIRGRYSNFQAQDGLAVSQTGQRFRSNGMVVSISNFPTASESGGDDDNLTGGAIAGIVIAVLLILLLVVIIVIIIMRKRKAKREEDEKALAAADASGSLAPSGGAEPIVPADRNAAASPEEPDLDWDHQSGRGGQRDDGVDRTVLLV